MAEPDDFDIRISDAVMSDDPDLLEKILVASLPVAPDELGAWLSLASAEGNLECMRVFTKYGANINFQSDDGESPFSWACATNQWASAKLLLGLGADVNALLSSGLTPLDCAVCSSSPEFRQWLRENGGKRNDTFDEWPWPSSG